MADVTALKRFMVEHAGNDRLLARRVLLALWRKEAGPDDLTPFLRPLFTVSYFVTFHEYLAVWLIATGGRLPPMQTVGNGPCSRRSPSGCTPPSSSASRRCPRFRTSRAWRS